MHVHDFEQRHSARPAAFSARHGGGQRGDQGTSCAVRQHLPIGQLGVRRAQVAEHSKRQASHRSAAVDGKSITLRLILADAHPNRDEGDLRAARVGLSAVLRVRRPVAAVRDRTARR